MSKEGISGLLVYGNQMKTAPLQYVSEYTLLGRHAFFYLPLEGNPILFISEKWDRERAFLETEIGDIRLLGTNWTEELVASLPKERLNLGLVGIEFMGRSEATCLLKALGEKVSFASSLLNVIARRKTPYELNLIREAAAMADAGFLRAMKVAKEGMSDYELVAEIDFVMRRLGATDNFQMLAIGRNITGMLLPYGKKIEKGDLLLFEITPANGSETYSAQLCKTAIFGEPPSSLLEDKYRLLREALETSLALIKPQAKISEVARIQNEIISKAGYGEYCRPPYMRARGHGFGLGRIEIDEDSPLFFEEGMSLVVHPNQYLPETGYLALGEHIIVTKEGIERLTKTVPQIYLCP